MKVYSRDLVLSRDGEHYKLSQLLFTDHIDLVVKREVNFQHLLTEFGRICKWRKLLVNGGIKSKVMRSR